jgi:hypothetical protein
MSTSRLAVGQTIAPPWEAPPSRCRTSLGTAASLLAALISEYRWAIAAERRYEELAHMPKPTAAGGGSGSSDVARQVFDEMYAWSSPGRGLPHGRPIVAACTAKGHGRPAKTRPTCQE